MQKLPSIKTDLSGWYNEVIIQAELADQSPVRGCIVIRPYGNDIWEAIKGVMDKKIKDTGHKNALFPLLIPMSFFKKEAEHVEGFAPEMAVVTHAGGKELAEPLVVRPTSETIIHHMFAQWIKSYRDLPLKINQWCNVVRWEMRSRAFLRTTEFFWQEGHTAHATEEEAQEEALTMLGEYKDLAENYLAIPVITGRKSEGEKFPGAKTTYTFEGIMPDGKALQMGTSHLLSQSFAHAFEMKFQNKEGGLSYPWLTSWGSTTRLVGAVIMVHGDDKGLILPPKIAPIQVVIVPIFKTDEQMVLVTIAAKKIMDHSKDSIRIHIDMDDNKTPGNKYYHWELRGVPFRLEIGPRDVESQKAVLVNRLTGEKEQVAFSDIEKILKTKLAEFQKALFDRALEKRNSLMIVKKTLAECSQFADTNFMKTGFCETKECEKVLKEHRLSIRCLIDTKELQECYNCGKASTTDCIVARSY